MRPRGDDRRPPSQYHHQSLCGRPAGQSVGLAWRIQGGGGCFSSGARTGARAWAGVCAYPRDPGYQICGCALRAEQAGRSRTAYSGWPVPESEIRRAVQRVVGQAAAAASAVGAEECCGCVDPLATDEAIDALLHEFSGGTPSTLRWQNLRHFARNFGSSKSSWRVLNAGPKTRASR